MKGLSFVYCNAKGETATWALPRWKEVGHYIQGCTADDTTPRTFRKDRIREYLFGHEQLSSLEAPDVPAPAPRKPADSRPQILFTGFPKVQRADLEHRAEEEGLKVVKTPTVALALLCAGPNAGPSKVEKARAAGAFIVDPEQLLHLLATGEIPEPEYA